MSFDTLGSGLNDLWPRTRRTQVGDQVLDGQVERHVL